MVALRNYGKKKAMHHCGNYCTQSIIDISLPNHPHVIIKSLRPPSTALLDINSRVTLPYGIKYTSSFSPFPIGNSVTDIGTKWCNDACNSVTVTISLIQVHGEWVLVICCTILQVRSFHIWYLFRPVPNKIRFESFLGENVTMIQWVWSPGAMTGNYFSAKLSAILKMPLYTYYDNEYDDDNEYDICSEYKN